MKRDKLVEIIAKHDPDPVCNHNPCGWHYAVADRILAAIEAERNTAKEDKLTEKWRNATTGGSILTEESYKEAMRRAYPPKTENADRCLREKVKKLIAYLEETDTIANVRTCKAIVDYASIDTPADKPVVSQDNTIVKKMGGYICPHCRVLITLPPAPPAESLAELAERKGEMYSVFTPPPLHPEWVISCGYGYGLHRVNGNTYQEAESKARAYLETLPDTTEGGKE